MWDIKMEGGYVWYEEGTNKLSKKVLTMPDRYLANSGFVSCFDRIEKMVRFKELNSERTQ
jgi:hypothetical protein